MQGPKKKNSKYVKIERICVDVIIIIINISEIRSMTSSFAYGYLNPTPPDFVLEETRNALHFWLCMYRDQNQTKHDTAIQLFFFFFETAIQLDAPYNIC